jgi:hypothetical protein
MENKYDKKTSLILLIRVNRFVGDRPENLPNLNNLQESQINNDSLVWYLFLEKYLIDIIEKQEKGLIKSLLQNNENEIDKLAVRIRKNALVLFFIRYAIQRNLE